MEHFLSEIVHTLNLLTKKCATQSANSNLWVLLINAVSNGNRTEWSPILSVIIRVINKIGRPRSGSPICLITSMLTDRIGRHEVMLPINHNYNKICDVLALLNKKHKKFQEFSCLQENKKPFKCTCAMVRTVLLVLDSTQSCYHY